MKKQILLFTISSLLLTTAFASSQVGRTPAQANSSDGLDPRTNAALKEQSNDPVESPSMYSPKDLVVPSPKIYRVIKSNPKHFANFFNEQAANFLKEGSNGKVSFVNLLDLKGLVFEDSHTFNFGDVHFPKKKNEKGEAVGMFGPIDFDDFRSNGPLLESLLKKMTTDKAYSPEEVSLKDVYGNYIQGLRDGLVSQNKSTEKWPRAVAEAVNLKFDQVLNEMSAYAKKRTDDKGKGLDHKKAGTIPIENSDGEVINEHRSSEKFFAAEMTGYKIHDTGYGTRDSGSSKGMMRFLFLVSKDNENPNDLYLFEFKQKAPSAATELFGDQPPADVVFNKVKEVYYNNKVDSEFLDVVKSPTGLFYEKRMRGNNRIEIDTKNFIAISYFEAYWEGLIAARQSRDYAKALMAADRAGFYDAVARPLAREYLKTLVNDVTTYIDTHKIEPGAAAGKNALVKDVKK